VDGARSHDDNEPGIPPLDDIGNGRASVGHDIRSPLADWNFLKKDGRRDKRANVLDTEVVGRS
jgi:hypothetical protein